MSSAAPALRTHSLPSGPSPSRLLPGEPDHRGLQGVRGWSGGGPAPRADNQKHALPQSRDSPPCGCFFPVRGHFVTNHPFHAFKTRTAGIPGLLLPSPQSSGRGDALPFPAQTCSRSAEASKMTQPEDCLRKNLVLISSQVLLLGQPALEESPGLRLNRQDSTQFYPPSMWVWSLNAVKPKLEATHRPQTYYTA